MAGRSGSVPPAGRTAGAGPEPAAHELWGAELVVHLFAPVDGPEAADAYGFLRDIWSACRRTLKMGSALDRLGVPADLPGSVGDLPSRGLLAAQLNLGDGTHQALFRRDHDLLCLSVMLAPAVDDGALDWSAPEDQWSGVADELPASLVGAVRLYQGHLGRSEAGPRAVVAAAPELARTCANAWSGWHQAPGWEERGATTGLGFAVWEPAAPADDQIERRLLILVPGSRDGELVAWTWNRRDAAAPAFQRYLAGAAKVRYQWRVRDGGDAVHGLRDRLDERGARLREFLRDPVPFPDRVAACVHQLHADQVDLTTVTTRMTEMRRSVEISGVNMAAILAADGTVPRDGDPFATDRRLVEHVVGQLDDDLVFLGAADTRVEAVLALAARSTQHVRSAEHVRSAPDIRLDPEEMTQLRAELAAAFGAGVRASQLLEEIGLPRARQFVQGGATPLEWWTEMLRELGNGAVDRPYRKTLEAALREYGYNDVFVRLARRHGLR
ncbi:CATRA conflict system CASPASE/TPR repeat-associated protein [Frankia sp. EAN1pec]|uniref:CATRA conflict system CASPASE/TPR repeat-associated protein n=1 Tax=Parafrankia sp. (strain EAN1pec) TaxID=298653 RepID=UPI00059EB925